MATISPNIVNLLVHSDTTNGSQVFVDDSPEERAITANGNIQHSTDYAKFGATSIKSDGTGDYLTVPYVIDDFDWWNGCTVAMWVYASSFADWGYSSSPVLIGNASPTAVNNYWSFGPLANGTLALYYYNGSPQGVSTAATINIGTWVHIALTVDGGTIRLFIDGVKGHESSVAGTPQSSASFPLAIGQINNTCLTGYFDEILYADEALWTEDFTPPTQAYTFSILVEDEYSFSVNRLTEEFRNFNVNRAILYEEERQFRVFPAGLYEDSYPYNVKPSVKVEDEYRFDIDAYKAYEDMYTYAVKAGQVFSEDEFQFSVAFRENELYEEMYSLWTGGLVLSTAIQAGLSVLIDNVLVEAISVSGGRNGYYDLFRAIIPDDQIFRSLPVGAAASLIWHSAKLEGDTSTPVVDKSFTLFYKQASTSVSASEQGDIKTATIDLVSPTAQLDRLPAPIYGSEPVSTTWAAGTMASSVLDDLCLPYLAYTLDYPDFPLLQDLDGGDRYPIEIINDMFPFAWIGPDETGELLIRRKLAHSPEEMLEAGFSYDIDIPESEYIIDANTDYPSVPLYNQVTVATIAESDAVIFPAPEIIEDEDDRSMAVVYGYRYPWFAFDLITCNTECGNIVISAGTEEIMEVTESLDFEDGKATFPLPIYEFVSVDWDCNVSLGTITASGDGQLKAAVDGWSYGAVTCKVRRMVYQLTAYNRDDDLKFRLRDKND